MCWGLPRTGQICSDSIYRVLCYIPWLHQHFTLVKVGLQEVIHDVTQFLWPASASLIFVKRLAIVPGLISPPLRWILRSNWSSPLTLCHKRMPTKVLKKAKSWDFGGLSSWFVARCRHVWIHGANLWAMTNKMARRVAKVLYIVQCLRNMPPKVEKPRLTCLTLAGPWKWARKSGHHFPAHPVVILNLVYVSISGKVTMVRGFSMFSLSP